MATTAGVEGLAPFPSNPRPVPDTARLQARGIGLRHAHAGDLPWIAALYASTREDELAAVPWPQAMREAFLAQQFALQHRHYLAHYGDSDFLVVETAHGPIGRLYVQPARPAHLLVDVSLVPGARNQGIGAMLVAGAQSRAAAEGCGMQLHVAVHNPAAQRLYARLGFEVDADEGAYRRMRWPAPRPLS
ncbi:GNAT family N-acetyltransferase [Marilutibacter spongiae]|uniref:GNAT family N-acetyltransferase n=1 Tax=Marilutibacter spongiae TaxID=2025720 RepID=A0A7W3Y6E2_9GAMM|nr:GNAT family N-acetyltransferase [Lysobacter spongiae]MBB1060841.1 GNAT family N-acetyltransferase [Lysobacter spongiae]